MQRFLAGVLAIALGAVTFAGNAGPLRERLLERQAARKARAAGPAQVLRDMPYGGDPRQRFDVYLPAQAAPGAPVIFMVHGGGWRTGGKAETAVVANKAPYFTGRGYVFISINYRMLPDADPLRQAQDVAQALATAQGRAAEWGADRRRFILMGHSAGAHMVALLAAEPSLAAGSSWLGTVSLDSGALDVPDIMQQRHLPLYDEAFGRNPAYWRTVSPLHVLQPGARPMLLVCSTQRDSSCRQAHDFVQRLGASGARGEVLEQAMSHREINLQLGADGPYTGAVQAFIDSLLAR
ncbi:alpha/beta hydrolase [Pseudoduganella violaceinigra]|uniref:alpha/beta hydrolase n=1 Tax=Pseudoduganella violaceinigra TaxID=246602 RepID=UPI0004167C15|nr:alpha/beta hydrolase [Pseudoduganella violaceinigra]